MMVHAACRMRRRTPGAGVTAIWVRRSGSDDGSTRGIASFLVPLSPDLEGALLSPREV
ncbi:hypothetical protein BD626DRAFT_504483 [Schizophyllum amplum]|uniref:Uncharacterized protein n=1 Tax=Schizophyllum amplum TaxID=97359 RepID=A0A550C6Z4_9AGAR|nr:hypothetical protein BD626DRAFT_504483 [Auriculariopsis ampla]